MSFHVSFSVLEPLSKGNIDEAVRRYYRIEQQPTQAMIEGKQLHEQWRDEVDRTGHLPAVFGAKPLYVPQTELYLKMQIDWIEFVGIIDLIDQDVIYEYKTGRAGVNYYANSNQWRCYKLLAEANGFTPKEVQYLFLNQHEQLTEKGKIFLTDTDSEIAKDWIITWASELHEAVESVKGIKE